MTDNLKKNDVFTSHLSDNYECENYFIGYGGHCYRRITSAYSYLQAKSYCKDLGGYLVEIESQEEQDFVEGTKPLERS